MGLESNLLNVQKVDTINLSKCAYLAAAFQCLTGLLQSCQNYCTGVQRSNEDGVHFKTDEVARDFARQSNLLFKILSTIQGRQTGSQLSQLLLRIDYNNYFSKHGHGLVDCA